VTRTNVPGATMVEFDSLPQTTRSLILATLGLEIASANCRSIFDLARKRNQSVADVWRDVCRKGGQQRCTMPPRVTRPNYVATDEPPDDTSIAASAGSVMTAVPGTTHPSANAAGMKPAANAAGMKPAAHAAVHATASSATKGSSSAPPKGAASAISAPRSQSRTIALAVGLGAILVIGIALIVALPGSSDQASTARPTEAVHVKSNETARAKQPDAASVPTPQGTVRRMEEINKAFSKR
jgi:hypothetical protein